MFCISKYRKGINTKLHLHYKTKCTSWNWSFFIMVIYIADFRMFRIPAYSEGINTKLYLHYKTKCTSWNWLFFYHGYIYRISVCFVFPCTVKVSVRNYTSTIWPSVATCWNWSFFYHGYIYRISVCFVLTCTVKIWIRKYTSTIRPSVHLEIGHYLSWLYIPDFRMFCIPTYSEGINTKLHLDNKSKCTSWNWSFFYHGYIYRISVCFVLPRTVKVSIRTILAIQDQVYILKLIIFLSWLYIPDFRIFLFPCTVKVSIRNYTWTIRASVHLEIDHFFIMVIYTGFPYLLYFHVQWRYQYETTPALYDQV